MNSFKMQKLSNISQIIYCRRRNFLFSHKGFAFNGNLSSCRYLHERSSTQLITTENKNNDVKTVPDIIDLYQDKRVIYNSSFDAEGLYRNRSKQSMAAKRRLKNLYTGIHAKKVANSTQSRILEIILNKSVVKPTPKSELVSLPCLQYNNNNELLEVHCIKEKFLLPTSIETSVDYDMLPKINIKDEIAEKIRQFDEGNLKPVEMYVSGKTNMRNKSVRERRLQRTVREESIVKFKIPLKRLSVTEIEEANKIMKSSSGIIPRVACGGCGALFHCDHPTVPGYLSSEEFKKATINQLHKSKCHRCTSLCDHTAPQEEVHVSPSWSEEQLRLIRGHVSLVVLVLDITDAPCFLHPHLAAVIGENQPIILVGNKVDLLPQDSEHYLRHVQESLLSLARRRGLRNANIVDTCLVSGLTGYGLNELVGALRYHWENTGDVFLVGSSNVGKSTLFNKLMESELLHQQANAGCIPRATTSKWPGTTLAMLKFPMQPYDGPRRLEHLALGTSQNALTTLSARLHPDGARSLDCHWLFDTPSLQQERQAQQLLTHAELQQVIPSNKIIPKSFKVTPGRSIFIAGLGRLDILHLHHTEPESIGRPKLDYVRVTVFRSRLLPITVVRTVDASALYRDHLGSELFAVPFGGAERMKHFPALQPTFFRTRGIEGSTLVTDALATADVVLSNAGWISVWASPNTVVEMRAWTPFGSDDAYLRRPALLPHAVSMRGAHLKGSINYGRHYLWKPQPWMQQNETVVYYDTVAQPKEFQATKREIWHYEQQCGDKQTKK
uniref:Nitric oxide-associated protein 1-like n=1 Tax=Hirondellea gigas TaxID=1518452 RepID=A0A2P2I5Z7_9CRUS